MPAAARDGRGELAPRAYGSLAPIGEAPPMRRRKTNVELTVRYEPSANGWLTATFPAVPCTVSVGRERAEARENVLDALAMMLSTTPELASNARADEERVTFSLGAAVVVEKDLGRGL